MNSKLIEMSSNNWKMMDQHRNKSYFSLEGQNITHLPILICPEMKNVEYLNLSKNLLETINGEIFNNFQNVKEIDLSDNSLANIDYVLIKLPKIRYINLYNNLIKTLTYEGFGWNRYLEVINIRYNRIREIRFETFQNQVLLKVLDLSHNKIKYIDPNAFFNNGQLTVLLLGYNLLYKNNRNLTKDLLQNQTKLQIFDLEANFLSDIDEHFFVSLGSLISLNLSVNRIRSLKPNLLMFNTCLRVLNLNSNDIEHIPVNFFNPLLELNTLHLENTSPSLTLSPLTLAFNENLTTIYISNYIVGLNFIRLTSISFNGISGNESFIPGLIYFKDANKTVNLQLRRAFAPNFTLKPTDFTLFWKLLSLDLSDNKFRYLEPLLFAELHILETLKLNKSLFYDRLSGPLFDPKNHLRHLTLNFCRITQLNKSLLTNLTSLTRLELNWNKFETIPNDIFNDVVQLKYLALTGCLLKGLPIDLFCSNPKLSKIHLEISLIQSLDVKLVSSLKHLKEIYVSPQTKLNGFDKNYNSKVYLIPQ